MHIDYYIIIRKNEAVRCETSRFFFVRKRQKDKKTLRNSRHIVLSRRARSVRGYSYLLGDTPKYFLNTVLKYFGLSKPVSTETSVTERP